MTASWIRDKATRPPPAPAAEGAVDMEDIGAGGRPVGLCSFYETLEEAEGSVDIPMGVYDLDQLKDWGRKKGWCPYFLARRVSIICGGWTDLYVRAPSCHVSHDSCYLLSDAKSGQHSGVQLSVHA